MFSDLIIPTLVLGLGLWVIKPKPPTRGLLKWGSILLLTTVTLLAVQSPSLAGFITAAETFAKSRLPGNEMIIEVFFDIFRWVSMIAMGLIGITALIKR